MQKKNFFFRHQWIPLLYLAFVVYDWDVGEKGGRTNKYIL